MYQCQGASFPRELLPSPSPLEGRFTREYIFVSCPKGKVSLGRIILVVIFTVYGHFDI